MSGDESEITPKEFGNYELIDLIGEGDIGRVYSARALNAQGFEKRLVIKRIRRDLSQDPKFVESFISEAKLAVSLSHTNIVQVVEIGEHDGLPFIVMEHVGGMDLAKCNRLMKNLGKRWDSLLAAFITAEVAMGLDHAHRRRDLEGRPLGIVHQDVTPSNVLLSFQGAVKLTDFGMAWVTGPERLDRAAHPRYLAPEQIRGEPVDPRTDVYCCGLLLYEMLAGQPPLQNLGRDATVERLGTGTVPVLGENTKTKIDKGLVEVLARATSPWPDDRFEDAAEFYEELMSTIFSAGRQMGRRELVELLEELKESHVDEEETHSAEEVERALGSWHSITLVDVEDEETTINGPIPFGEQLGYEPLATGVSSISTRVDTKSVPLPPPAKLTPMRGRQQERHMLSEAVSEAARKTPNVVQVLGDEGSGKTRLILEVVGKLRSGEADLDFYSVSCRDLPKVGRYSAVRSILRGILGFDSKFGGNDAQEATRGLREFGLSQFELEALQDVIGVGPGNAPPGPGRARAAGRGFSQILRKLGEKNLTIVFWDDADLMDPDSMRLISRASKYVSHTRLLIVLACVEATHGPISNMATRVISLEPLQPDSVEKIILDCLAVQKTDPKLIKLIRNKAQGNPRWLTEIIRMLLEYGYVTIRGEKTIWKKSKLDLGESIDDVIENRLARLNELQRTVLEVAAFIGMNFEVRILVSALGIEQRKIRSSIDELVTSRIIKVHSPDSCTFAHQRFRNLVIEALSSDEINEIHSRIAEAMASSKEAHDAQWRLRCAHHLRNSGQRQRARDLLATSAAQLEASGATDAAIDHFSAALELTHGSEEAPVALALGLRTATLAVRCGRLREGLRATNMSVDIARKTRNRQDEIKSLVLAGRLVGAAGKGEDASNRFRDALKLAESIDDPQANLLVRGAMGELLYQTGDYRRAMSHLDQAIGSGMTPESTRYILLSASGRAISGDTEQALATMERVEAALENQDDPNLRSSLLFSQGILDWVNEKYEKASEYFQASRDLARKHGLHHANAQATHHLGCVQLILDQPQRAFASLRYSYELSREHGFERLIRLNVVALSALDVLHHGRIEPIKRIQKALDETRESGFLSDLIEIRFFLGQALLATGQKDEAKKHLEQAQKAGHATANLLFEAPIKSLK